MRLKSQQSKNHPAAETEEAVTEEAGPEPREADSKAVQARIETKTGAPDIKTNPHSVPAGSIGSMEKILGIVPRLRLVLGPTSRCPSLQETVETSASLIC